MRRSTTRARHGDYLVVDDRTGFTQWRSDCVKEWTGAIVHKSVYEARHPQDYLRPRRERFGVPDARPEPAIADLPFTGPIITEIAADQPGNNDEYAPMGPLGAFALGQAEDDRGDQEESNQAGALSITVVSTSRMSGGDRIGVILDTGDLFQTEIEYVIGPTILQLTSVLPGSTSPGNRVFDYTAAIPAQIE